MSAAASIGIPSMHCRQAAAEQTAAQSDSSGTPTAAAAGAGGAGATAGPAVGRSEHDKMMVKARHVWLHRDTSVSFKRAPVSCSSARLVLHWWPPADRVHRCESQQYARRQL